MPLPGPLKNFLRGESRGSASGGGEPPGRFHRARLDGPEVVTTRRSRALEEFFLDIREETGLTILDLGGASQENVNFITNLGHRLYSEDFLQILQETFGADGTVDHSNPGRIDFFLRQALDYPEDHFDGVLLWDSLEYLAPALLHAVVAKMRRIARRKSQMLAFFESDDKLERVPCYTFRILETSSLQLTQRGTRPAVQLFNNRGLEKLFGDFQSVKFFLTRERLREVLVRV
ncbi:MAG: class I SAM-dependent methyltransferase [Bryobacteraceae bacterium]